MKVECTLRVGQQHDLISLTSSDELLEQGMVDMTDHVEAVRVTAVLVRRKLRWWEKLLNVFGTNFQELRRVEIGRREGELQKLTTGNWRLRSVVLHKFDLEVRCDLELSSVIGQCADPAVEAFEIEGWRVNLNRRPQAE